MLTHARRRNGEAREGKKRCNGCASNIMGIMSNELIPLLAREAATKIVLLVMDGLGGFRTAARRSELHEARTPNLDQLAAEGSNGVHTVVAPGVTPGSGAGHLALFGYDPLTYQIGRGALSAAGIGYELKPGEVAARVNFCTLDAAGNIQDRRAGRISTEETSRLCELITKGVSDVTMFPERDHRALFVMTGSGLSPDLADTDPQVEGYAPLPPTPLTAEAAPTAALLTAFLNHAHEVLKNERANFILLRGFDTHREVPGFASRYRLKGFGVAGYPMYIGIARLVGMDVADLQPSFAAEVAMLSPSWDSHDFFYIHHKKTDSAGEDGNFDAKVAAIEEVDAVIPSIMDLQPDVICVTGDHSTPSPLKAHSWHPVPFLMWGANVGLDSVDRFNEEDACAGAFGHILGKDLMPLMLAAAGRLAKFGA